MNRTIRVLIIVILISFVGITLSSCNRHYYTLTSIESIDYNIDYNAINFSDKLTAEDDEELVREIYAELRKVNFNKKRIKTDFWTRNEITYDAPERYMSMNVALSNGKRYTYYYFDDRVYSSLTGYEYSIKGTDAFRTLYSNIYKQMYTNASPPNEITIINSGSDSYGRIWNIRNDTSYAINVMIEVDIYGTKGRFINSDKAESHEPIQPGDYYTLNIYESEKILVVRSWTITEAPD